MDIQQLLPLGIIIVVLGFVLTIGQSILADRGDNSCTGSWITNTTRPTGANTVINPVTGAWYGCCTTIGTGGGNNCSAWTTNSYALNATSSAVDSLNETTGWLPTIVTVVVAAIIIGILITALLIRQFT